MRLYKITATISSKELTDDAVLVKFVGSQSEAATTRKEFIDEGAKRKDIESIEVDVPTDKAGLIAYLNGLVAA